ncbi:MAG: DUF4440 domain-containing protein [Pseudomonadota bacterium]
MANTLPHPTVVGASAEDADKLKAIYATWMESYNAGDLESFMGLLHDDVIVMAENQPTVAGKAAARAYFAARVGRPGVTFIDELLEIRVNGSWAYFRGDFTFESAPTETGGETHRARGRYLVLYEKGDDGEWRMLRDIDNGLP